MGSSMQYSHALGRSERIPKRTEGPWRTLFFATLLILKIFGTVEIMLF